MALSEKQLRDIINGVHSGKYTLDNLPYSLFAHTASELVDAFEMGWGKPVLSSPDIYSPDIATFNSFRKNIWYFSANKSVAEVRELNGLMYDQDGNRRSLYDFTKDALKVDKTFNVQYLATEYDLTNKLAHNAREWKEIEETKDVFPILEWVTVMDANTRHAKFNGITLPVDDPFWGTHPQPLEYGCRCRKRQHRDRAVTDAAIIADIPEPPKRPWHANPWQQAEIWKNSEHPYGQDLSKEARMGVAKMVVQAIDETPFVEVARSREGNVLREHPKHVLTNGADDIAELARNRDSGKVIINYSHDIDLLPNYGGMDDRHSPDALIDGRVLADFKRASFRSIITRVNEALSQGASIAIIQLDHSSISAKDAGNKVRGAFKNGRIDEGISEVWFTINGQLIKANRKSGKELVDKLIKAESAVP